MNNTTTKEVLEVSAFLGGYPRLDRSAEYLLFAQLYNEGYTYVQEGEEATLYVCKEPLPKAGTEAGEVAYFNDNYLNVYKELAELGFEVKDLAEARPDLLPTPSKVQQAYNPSN